MWWLGAFLFFAMLVVSILASLAEQIRHVLGAVVFCPLVLLTVASLSWSLGYVMEFEYAGIPCPNCGYDRRATPDRCPECGLVVQKKMGKMASVTDPSKSSLMPSTPSPSAPPDDSTVWIGPHCVLFLDILSQRDAIARLKQLPTSDAEKAEYVRALKGSAGRVEMLRKWVRSGFDAYANAPITVPLEKLSPEQQALFHKYRDGKVEIQSFSDTVVCFTPLHNEDGFLRMREVHALLMIAGTVMMMGHAAKTPLRGGIDINFALTLEDRDLYGPAASEAYRLESQVAQYPRIAVGGSVLAYLAHAADAADKDPVTAVNRELAKVCMELIAQDVDGVAFVDYLGERFRRESEIPEGAELVRMGLEFVRAEHERFMQAHDHKLALRYAWLRTYYEEHAKAWLKA